MDKYEDYVHIGLGTGGPSEIKIRQFERNYARCFPSDKAAAILDIGPGKGEMLTCLSRKGFTNLEGVDISASVVDFIGELGFEGSQSDDLSTFLEERKGKYDMITLCDVIEHIPKHQIVDILSAVRKALSDKGLLIVQVPNMQSITANLFLYDDFTHETGYTERSLVHMLTLAGFSKAECHGFEFLEDSLRCGIQAMLRRILWTGVRWIRKINGTMPHRILHPVFYAVVRK